VLDNVLFVDPNGSPTGTVGDINDPWNSPYNAINYCTLNGLTNHTVWIWPGTYTAAANITVTNLADNLTIRLCNKAFLNMGIYYLKFDRMRASIIGDDRTLSSVTFGYPGCAIYGSGTTYGPIWLAGAGAILSLRNLTIEADGPTQGAISLGNDDNELFIDNCRIENTGAFPTIKHVNLQTAGQKLINIRDSFLVSAGTTNIDLTQTASVTHYLLFENTKFETKTVAPPQGHIETSTGTGVQSYAEGSNSQFYASGADPNIFMWYDTSGRGAVDIVIPTPIIGNNSAFGGGTTYTIVNPLGIAETNVPYTLAPSSFKR
jgi:hypothetical protein